MGIRMKTYVWFIDTINIQHCRIIKCVVVVSFEHPKHKII